MPLSRDINDRIDSLARKYGLRLVLLFGSEVSGKTHPGSDLDIAVMFENHTDVYESLSDLQAELQDIFRERDVDLGLINGADPLFLKKMLESCELVYGEPRALAELKMYAFRRYIDHKRYLELEERYVGRLLERFRKGAA